MDGGVCEDRAAVGVEQDVVGRDRAVGEAGTVQVVHGLGQGNEEGDELAASQRAAAG
ncbi:hypothetical protein OHA18_29545 [Kribbella sp. NBC_00709]|nr:hypothetical protein [Kribbella sp. NBC_00709]